MGSAEKFRIIPITQNSDGITINHQDLLLKRWSKSAKTISMPRDESPAKTLSQRHCDDSPGYYYVYSACSLITSRAPHMLRTKLLVVYLTIFRNIILLFMLLFRSESKPSRLYWLRLGKRQGDPLLVSSCQVALEAPTYCCCLLVKAEYI